MTLIAAPLIETSLDARAAAVESALGDLVVDFEAGALSPREAEGLVERFAGMERLAQAGKVLAAGRVAEGEGWQRHGDRSAAEWLARTTKSSVTEAGRLVETARRLVDQPQLEQAMRAGRLNADQATEISQAAAADPAAEGRLVHRAQRDSLRSLRDDAARTKAAALTDDAARHGAARRNRRLATAVGHGEWRIEGTNTTSAGALVEAALKPYHELAFRAGKAAGRRDGFEAYRADALEMLAADALGVTPTCLLASFDQPPVTDSPIVAGGPPATVIPWNDGQRFGARLPGGRAKLIGRFDIPALHRGTTRPGELCEINGLGPIPVPALRELIAAADPFLAAVVTHGHDVHTVAHLGRHPTAHQRTALELRDAQCVVEGCTKTICEIDHDTGWAITHDTATGDIQFMCEDHHPQKTAGARLQPPDPLTGKRRLIPPHHPHHPDHPDQRAHAPP